MRFYLDLNVDERDLGIPLTVGAAYPLWSRDSCVVIVLKSCMRQDPENHRPQGA